MKFKFLQFIIILLLGSPFNAHCSFITPSTQQYFVKDGLSSNLVEQIEIDNSGFIWIATSRGLNKFDGVNFIHYKPDPNDAHSINEDFIRCLSIDDDDNIWVGTKGGGLNYFDRKTGKFSHFMHDPNDDSSISHDEILDIFRDSKNRLWIGTEGGLNLFDEKNKKFTRFLVDKNDPYSIPADAVLKINEDHYNNIWIGTWNGGLSFVEEGDDKDRAFTFHTTRHSVKDPSSIGSNHCWDITFDKNGVMWLGLFNSGASIVMPSVKYRKGKADEFVNGLKFLNYKSIYESGYQGLAHNNVTDIVFTDDNDILFATTNGLSILDYSCLDLSKSWAELNQEKEDLFYLNNHLSDKQIVTFDGAVIRSIIKANDGTLWFASYNGVTKASKSKRRFTTHLRSKNNQGDFHEVKAIHFSKYGYHLLVTNLGVLKYSPTTGDYSEVRNAHGDLNESITCIYEDSKRTIWIGTKNGIYKKEANSKTFVHYSERLDSKLFFQEQKIGRIFEDKLGHLWICADYGIAELDPDTHEFTIHGDVYNDPYGIGLQNVSDIVEDEKGRIWFSHLGLGLVKFERKNGKNTIEQIGFSNTDNSKNISSKFAKAMDCKDGILWIGTERGLSSYDIEKDVAVNYDLPELQGYLSGRILSVSADNANGIWITIEAEGAELICFNHQSGRISRYGNQNGLPHKKFSYKSFHKSEGRKLSFGSNSGFVSFYGESIVKQIDVPAVTLTNLSTINKDESGQNNGLRTHSVIHNDGLSQVETIELSHEDNQFSIGFSVLDFRFANSFKYAYQLEGLHEDWIHIGSKNTVSFTGLAPGNYVFKVKAQNQDGYWSSKITSVKVLIKGPWYQSWLAYIGWVLLLILVGYAFYLRKVKIAQKEKIQLEMLVEDRTSALKSITLKEKQARISAELMREDANNAQQRAESANLAKSQFLANMSHEIRTPMNGILGMLQLLNKTELNTEQSDYVRISTESALGLIRIINDILDFSKVESDKIEIESEKVDIHAIVENVIELNATNCQEKHIEISYLIEPSVPKIIIGDEVRVRQILTNLVSNAIKFTSRGEVSLTVSVDPSAAGRANSNIADLRFVVKDTGIGISKKKIVQLFQAFSQVDASITRKFGGTGLGLAISRKLARLMNGDVTLGSKLGVGTKVTFNLSCEFDTDTVTESKTDFIDKSAAIIEKSAVSGKSLVNSLEHLGFNSFSLSREITGELLDELIQNPVDVLFIDSSFFTPSTELMLNKIKGTTDTKIVLNVPKLFPSLTIKCIDMTLAKPFKRSSVLCTIRTLFDKNPRHKRGEAIHNGNCSMKKSPVNDVFNEEFAKSSPLKILVAEDHKINQMLIKKVLNKLGYHPFIVENGQVAIDESLRNKYDVIFMDIQMPVLDGIKATEQILENWKNHNEPYIIAMTANAMKGDREKYISCGMHDYISKPFLINDLQALLVKYSEQKYDAQLGSDIKGEFPGS